MTVRIAVLPREYSRRFTKERSQSWGSVVLEPMNDCFDTVSFEIPKAPPVLKCPNIREDVPIAAHEKPKNLGQSTCDFHISVIDNLGE